MLEFAKRTNESGHDNEAQHSIQSLYEKILRSIPAHQDRRSVIKISRRHTSRNYEGILLQPEQIEGVTIRVFIGTPVLSKVDKALFSLLKLPLSVYVHIEGYAHGITKKPNHTVTYMLDNEDPYIGVASNNDISKTILPKMDSHEMQVLRHVEGQIDALNSPKQESVS